jgi:hypothetical protein
VKLAFTNKNADLCSMNVYYTTADMFSDGTRIIHVNQPTDCGGDGTLYNQWNCSGNISEKDYFLVNRGYDSYILQYVSTDSTNNLIKIKDMCSGTSFDASTTTKFFYLGGQKYSFGVNTDTETIRVDQNGLASDTQVPLYTQHKAMIELVNSSTGSAGGPAQIKVTEAPFSAAGVQGASERELNVSVGLSSGEVDTIDVANDTATMAGTGGLIAKDETDYEYGVTPSGTYVVRNTESDTLKIYTPELPSPLAVAVGADPSFSAGEGVSGGTVEQAVKIQNSVSKMESEITTSTLNRDVILLGGPCANALVAEVLEMSASKPQCVSDFTAEYPTEGVIKVVSNAFASGQKALVVAGVDRDATRALAVKVMQDNLDYSA